MSDGRCCRWQKICGPVSIPDCPKFVPVVLLGPSLCALAQTVTDEGVREFIDQKLPLTKNDTWTQRAVLLAYQLPARYQS